MSSSTSVDNKLYSNPISIDLQLNLLNTWTRFRVAQYYQNIFLAHLDEHKHPEAEEHIRKQIKLTLEKRSPYFDLERLDQERKNILIMLRNKLNSIKEIKNSEELSSLCKMLRDLRDVTLLTAEQILKMYNIYHCSSPEAIEKQMEYYDTMLQNLDRDNCFLKDSVLSNYIVFDEGYDPFLMTQYERIHRNKTSQVDDSIKDLYSMNISYAYRLMKTKNMILELRSLARRGQTEQQEESINTSYRFYSNESNLSKKHYGRKRQQQNNVQIVPTERMTLRQNQPLRISPIQVYPSPKMKSRTTLYNDKQDRPVSSSNTEIGEGSKLNFMKIEPPGQSRSSSFHLKSFGRIKQRNLSNPRPHYDMRSRKLKELPVLEDKIGVSYKPSQDIWSKRSGRYRAGVGEIYRSVRLSPLKNRRYFTQAQEEDINRPSLLTFQQLKEKNKKIYFNQKAQNLTAGPKQTQPQKPSEVKQEPTKYNVEDDGEEGGEQLAVEPNPKFKKIKYYNPITKQEYSMQETIMKDQKYDFNPRDASKNAKILKNHSSQGKQALEDEDEHSGLLYESPISKYSIKSLKSPKSEKKDQLQNRQNVTKHPRKMINQEAQTIEAKKLQRQPETNLPKPPPPPPKQKNVKYESQVEKSQSEHEPRARLPQKKSQQAQRSVFQYNRVPQATKIRQNPKISAHSPSGHIESGNMTLQQQQIIDERPQKQGFSQKPVIRTAEKQQIYGNPQKVGSYASPQGGTSLNNSQMKVSTTQKALSNAGDKKQIRMKVGKLNFSEVVSILQNIRINQKYKNSFEIDKLMLWIKVNQTYLVEFHVNDQLAILALCSPIPSAGMALKLWAPLRDDVDDTACLTLFKKYLELIQKTTTVEKILFSGKPFPGLIEAEFTMKKQNLYERIRKIPAKDSTNEFKPFVYIECSNVRFTHKGLDKILYSQQIEEFTQGNSFVIPFLGDVDYAKVPPTLQSLVKFTAEVADFKAVNQILTKEDFDNYQASQMNIHSIDLIRFYFNSPLKSTFISQDGFLKFTGALLHEKGAECIISVAISKNNGVMYFCKGLEWPSVFKLIQKASSKKVQFSVMMFNKKLYGKMPNSPPGCYGNWELNLIWEDEMQGRIKHNMKQDKNFGPEPFKVVIQLEQEIIYGFQVGKEDSLI